MHHARTSAQERSGLGPRALAVEQALSADFTSQKREVHTVRFGSISLDDTHFHVSPRSDAEGVAVTLPGSAAYAAYPPPLRNDTL